METLANLIKEYDANIFVFADDGNGCGFGVKGQAIDYDDDSAAAYGNIVLSPLDAPVMSDDGVEVNFASDWIDGENGYKFRIMF